MTRLFLLRNTSSFFTTNIHTSSKLLVDRGTSLAWLEGYEKCGLDIFPATKKDACPQNSQTKAIQNARNSPALIERILKLETAMRVKDLYPFVHAMPQSTSVVLEIARALFPFDKPFFHYLRPPIAPYTISREEVSRTVPKVTVREQRNSLLSLSYALTSGERACETAASWGFNNHHGKQAYFDILCVFNHLMMTQTFSSEPFFKEEVELKLTQLIRHFNRLAVGNFMVVGLPYHLLDMVYDSLAFNVPTGIDVRHVLNNPAKYCITRDYHMVTLPVCRDLNPDSGIVIVNANNTEETEAYCEGLTFKPMNSLPLFKKAFQGVSDHGFEEAQTKQREKLRHVLKSYTSLFAQFKDSPKELVSRCAAIDHLDTSQDHFDYPETLP